MPFLASLLEFESSAHVRNLRTFSRFIAYRATRVRPFLVGRLRRVGVQLSLLAYNKPQIEHLFTLLHGPYIARFLLPYGSMSASRG